MEGGGGGGVHQEDAEGAGQGRGGEDARVDGVEARAQHPPCSHARVGTRAVTRRRVAEL